MSDILTEEELKLRESKLNKITMSPIHRTMLDEIIASCRSTLSANAELKAENEKQSGAIDALQQQMWEGI